VRAVMPTLVFSTSRPILEADSNAIALQLPSTKPALRLQHRYLHLVSGGPIHSCRLSLVILCAHSTGLAVTACAPG
jgi:hypothetical protein